MQDLKIQIKSLLFKVTNLHKQSNKKNIFLFSTPRSGSTWLMEIIASQKGFKFYDEPLNIRRQEVLHTGIFTEWSNLMPDGHKECLIIEYLKELERNKYSILNPTPLRRNYRLITNRIIYKIHEVEHLINRIRDELNGHIIFLVRHPIATTVSRNVFPRLKHFMDSNQFQRNYLTNRQRKLSIDIYENGDKFEKGILSWCFQNLVPLKHLDRDGWTFVTYEEILLNSKKMCQKLMKNLELDNLESMLFSIDRPAHNIKISTDQTKKIIFDKENQERKIKLIKKWNNFVNEKEKNRAFEILTEFEIDVYYRESFIANEKYLNFSDTLKMLQGS